MNLTAAQQEAVAARGNVLVVAGAGTGKTRTLVERCLDCLIREKPRASLEEILLVTFTEAAATEMRQRIGARLEQESARNPNDSHWQEQLALFETAQIGTLHSFCFHLIRQHFYELELDPQLSVLPDEEARLIAEETLEALLQQIYSGKGRLAAAVQQLIQTQAKGSDQPIRALVLRLHHYTQTLPHPNGWIESQLALFSQHEPQQWREWQLEALADWRARGIPTLRQNTGGNKVAEDSLALLEGLPVRPSILESAAVLAGIMSAVKECQRGKKKHWIKPLEDFLDESRFLFSLTTTDNGVDPLKQDWDWVRSQMIALLQLAQDFGIAFNDAKRELGAVDFHDLEQYALRLLWDNEAGGPTGIAQEWREQLRFVFVDEYQDINAAQDRIIEAISREGSHANRFLVGDAKQSIYRFRLADPYIFQRYITTWGNGQGHAVPLVENFRSREEILNFINSVFAELMHRDLGGIEYDEQARLQFGTELKNRERPGRPNSQCPVELNLRIKGIVEPEDAEEPASEAAAEILELVEAAKEARLIALRLQELKDAGHPVWDEQIQQFRPVDWRDMAILLRAPSNKAESYAKEFTRLGIPLQVTRGGFYETLEIADLLSLLQVLDNPLQDLPVLAVLRSPLVGLTLDELAQIRIGSPGTNFWTALVRWNERRTESRGQRSEDRGQRTEDRGQKTAVGERRSETGGGQGTGSNSELAEKILKFLEQFGRWRRLARQNSLSRCLDLVLAETQYQNWLLTQPRGEQRCANLKRLLLLAQRFDKLQRQGLFRFLRFIEAQQRAATEPELPAANIENAVRLMSIHQSKGLEFPVVVVADLGKPFNLLDLRGEIILDERYGLCPQVKPPHTGKRYPSLSHWLAARRQRRELLGEELRLLYVAMTRARDFLILSGSVSKPSFEKRWTSNGEVAPGPLHKAQSFTDWLGIWFSGKAGANGNTRGANKLLQWIIHDDAELVRKNIKAKEVPPTDAPGSVIDDGSWQELQQRLDWRYPFMPAARLPAKTSVSALRRRAASGEEDESVRMFRQGFAAFKRTSNQPAKATAVEVGNIHHRFLQLVSLERTTSEQDLRAEADRIKREGGMKIEETELLDFRALAGFWTSDLGRRIRDNALRVRRELPFTFRLPATEVGALIGETAQGVPPDDFIVIQGVADLAVILDEAIWLVDFKTDKPGSGEDLSGEKYATQLRLYAQALSGIYGRPVTECWLHFLTTGQTLAVSLR